MKLIEAMIRPSNLEEVETALQEMGIDEIGVEEIRVTQLVRSSLKKGEALLYRGVEYVPDLMARVKVEIIAADGLVDKVVETIRTIAMTDRKGDCRIYILPLIEAL